MVKQEKSLLHLAEINESIWGKIFSLTPFLRDPQLLKL